MTATVATPTKAQRQQAIRDLLSSVDLSSQREVVEALAGRGLDCNQATVSRDLDEIGAVKVRAVDGMHVYRLRADLSSDPHARAEATLRLYVTGVDHSGNLAVLRTPPACAPPVASAIDLGGVPDVIATVAGDDTVLVVAADGVTGRTLAQHFRTLLDLPVHQDQP